MFSLHYFLGNVVYAILNIQIAYDILCKGWRMWGLSKQDTWRLMESGYRLYAPHTVLHATLKRFTYFL